MTEVEKIISETCRQLDDLCKTCSTSLSDIDKEINDIYHYIEFSDLDAYRGWKAYKMLKDKLNERRKIKDSLDSATRFSQTIKAKRSKIKNEHKTKKYTPRKAVIK